MLEKIRVLECVKLLIVSLSTFWGEGKGSPSSGLSNSGKEIAWPRRWGHYAALKRRLLFTIRHGVKSQKIWTFTNVFFRVAQQKYLVSARVLEPRFQTSPFLHELTSTNYYYGRRPVTTTPLAGVCAYLALESIKRSYKSMLLCMWPSNYSRGFVDIRLMRIVVTAWADTCI